jgi:F0F1-type ATP synthase membrane subunit b/b'
MFRPFPVALSEDDPIGRKPATIGKASLPENHQSPVTKNPFELQQSSLQQQPSDAQLLVLLQELTRLEELLLTSPKVPLTGKAMVGEDEIIEQIDFIRAALPSAFATAQEVIQKRDQLRLESENYAQQIVAKAKQQAFQISNELGIIDRAKEEAAQILKLTVNECETMRQQVFAEAEQSRERARQEAESIRQQVAAECQHIQRGADEYADSVLQSLEEQLGEMQARIQRGRQHLRD